MRRLYGDQVAFVQVNKIHIDITRKYSVSRYPSFYHLSGKNNKDGTRYSEQRTYDDLLEWMRMKARTNGCKLIVDEEEEEDVIIDP